MSKGDTLETAMSKCLQKPRSISDGVRHEIDSCPEERLAQRSRGDLSTDTAPAMKATSPAAFEDTRKFDRPDVH